MSAPPQAEASRVSGFRLRAMVTMMAVIAGITAATLYVAESNLTAAAGEAMQRDFQSGMAALRSARDIRHAVLVERCRTLVRKPRLHAALEDDALDLLYPSAADELADVLKTAAAPDSPAALHAQFYRFLDRKGAVIAAPPAWAVGELSAGEERQLALEKIPDSQQTGFLARTSFKDAFAVSEIITTPIVSSETGEVISALVLGFRPQESPPTDPGVRSGLWLAGRLFIPSLTDQARAEAGAGIVRALAGGSSSSGTAIQVGGAPQMLFCTELNAGSLYPQAYEVSFYPLDGLAASQRQLRWRIAGSGLFLLLGGFFVSHFLAGRLSVPVERLAVVSAEDRAGRRRAEAALESTHEELHRAARFSADASHQLKTPVTVMRAGLEEWLSREHLTPAECEEISALIQQTQRLSGVIEDLLLLSRMDAGRLAVEHQALDLDALIEAALDDLGARPGGLGLGVERDFPSPLRVSGEKRYLVLILQNLLENARKYNRPGGRIRVAATVLGGGIVLSVGNTGPGIPSAAQERIFERFHRGTMGEDIPGYGLGLNLARELARLHGGDLKLAGSRDDWTEFELHLRTAPPGNAPGYPP